MFGNKIVGITSDCLRLDNSINCKVYENVLFSYDGTNLNTAYPHGENGFRLEMQGVLTVTMLAISQQQQQT